MSGSHRIGPAGSTSTTSIGGANLWACRANTTTTSGDPGSGHLLWNNATQTSASQVNLSHLTEDNFDVDLFLQTITSSDIIFIQDQNDSTNYQKWTVASAITVSSGYVQVPVTLVTSGGTGTSGFPSNHQLFAARFAASTGGGGTVTNIATGTGLTGGPITATGTISITTSGVTTGLIANAAVTYGKIQNVGALSLWGNPTTGSTTGSEVTLGAGLSFSGSTLMSTATSSGAFDLISKTTTTGSTSHVTISSIPGTYSHLAYMIYGRVSTAAAEASIGIQFNGDTGNNYNESQLSGFGTGSAANQNLASTSLTAGELPGATATAGYAAIIRGTIGGYASTAFFKPFEASNGFGDSAASAHTYAIIYGGHWLSTASITSMVFFPSSGNFVDGTIVTLYGVS